jgi:hypothetical protein
VVHTYNPNYSGERNRRIMVRKQSRQKLVRPYLKKAKPKTILVRWHMPVAPATWEVEVGGSWFETTLNKVNARPYLKKHTKSRRTGGIP